MSGQHYAGYPSNPELGPPVPAMPQPQGMMQRPNAPNCPPGLEYLTMIDQLLVHQKLEFAEAVINFETKNRFVVKNSAGQQVYVAAEESGCCTRQFCGSRRGFTIHIYDNFGNEVMRVVRDFKLCAGCCWFACINCCAFEVRVEAPVGTPIGYVKQSCSAWRPKFEVFDADHEPQMHMTGPWCICECPCFDVDFDLYANNGDEIGRVCKQWSGLVKEMFADSDNFGISFPMDLDVKCKATLLGALFLIDMMFFEKSGSQN